MGSGLANVMYLFSVPVFGGIGGILFGSTAGIISGFQDSGPIPFSTCMGFMNCSIITSTYLACISLISRKNSKILSFLGPESVRYTIFSIVGLSSYYISSIATRVLLRLL